MKNNPVFESLKPLGFSPLGQLCVGSWDNYAWVMKGEKNGYVLQFSVDPDTADKAKVKELRGRVKKACGKNLGGAINKDILSFSLNFNRKSPYQEQFTKYVKAIVSAMKGLGIAPKGSCAICGAPRPDSFCLHKGVYQPVHNACMRAYIDQSRQKIEQNRVNGSYLTGFVGALLGMLVGSLASVLSIVLTDRIYAVLFALVPLASAWGYRKFNGKMDKVSVVIVVLLSFVSIFIMNYLTIAVYLIQDYALTLGQALWASSDLLLTGDGLLLIASNSVYMFLFMALGLFIAWRFIVNTNASSAQNLDVLLGTLSPNPAYSPEGYGHTLEYSEAGEK